MEFCPGRLRSSAFFSLGPKDYNRENIIEGLGLCALLVWARTVASHQIPVPGTCWVLRVPVGPTGKARARQLGGEVSVLIFLRGLHLEQGPAALAIVQDCGTDSVSLILLLNHAHACH